MPDESSSVQDINNKGEAINIKWDLQYHAYWEEIVIIYDEIYKELVKLVSNKNRLNNFKSIQTYG